MAHDAFLWLGYGSDMKSSRKRARLTLKQIDPAQISRLSRIENNKLTPTIDDVELYERRTGDTSLRTKYFERINRADAIEGASKTPSSDHFSSLLHLSDLETLVDLGDHVTIIERRTVIATESQVQTTTLRRIMAPVDGVTPSVSRVQAFRAGVVDTSWLEGNVFTINFRFPEALSVGDPPYTFYVISEYDRIAPRMSQMSGYAFKRYQVTIRFPSRSYQVFRIDGLPPQLADREIEHARKGEKHLLTRVPLDNSQQILAEFLDVQPARSYGLIWLESSTALA